MILVAASSLPRRRYDIRILIAALLLVSSLLFATRSDALQISDQQWQHVTFKNPDEIAQIFDKLGYNMDRWAAGDRTVPRVYLAWVPERWRKIYAPHSTAADKKRFFFFMYAPLVLRANEVILEQRSHLERIIGAKAPSSEDRAWLAKLAVQYGLAKDITPGSQINLHALLQRVDIVPVSLALSQAATESGWGTSRFTDEGNALFGQWTWSKDAIVPEEARKELGHYGIRAFESPFASIMAYMNNLNTHQAYEAFRVARAKAREARNPLSGNELAGALTNYSERGTAYVMEIRGLMRRNRLELTDKATLRTMTPLLLTPTGEQSR